MGQHACGPSVPALVIATQVQENWDTGMV